MLLLVSSPVTATLLAVIALIGLRAAFSIPLLWYANRKGYDRREFLVAAAFFSWVTTLIVLIALPKKALIHPAAKPSSL